MRIPKSLHRHLLNKAAHVMAARKPDFVIGEDYLRRWHVIRDGRRWDPSQVRNPDARHIGLNAYIHLIRQSDDDRALHDHPWPSCSIILAGDYVEEVPENPWEPAGRRQSLQRRTRDVVFRRSGSPHRLVIEDEGAITLFLTGPRIRDWGFWCAQGWRHWKDFTAPDDSGQVGRGCGEE